MSPGTPLSPERWQRVHDVFVVAISCDDAGERPLVLQQACGDDVELRRHVESLLEAHDKAGLIDDLADRIRAPELLRTKLDEHGWKGRKVGQYEVLEPLAAGGMGVVYKARDVRLGRQVALKCLPPHLVAEANAKERLLLEARTAAALDHPNICTIHEIGETDDGQLFIAMPLYDGETLEARLARGRLEFSDAVAIVLQVAAGLAKAHEHKVVHRDIKPSNVMLLADGGVKVLDFGIARVGDAALTTRGATVGTVAYMSPEQARGGPVDLRTDIWSLSVVIFEMITGRRPFEGDNSHALTFSILNGEPPQATTVRGDLPVEIDAVLLKGLAKAPANRYESMRSLAADLAPLVQHDDQRPSSAIGERRRAAVLVSVISDYASLVEQLAPDDLSRLVARIRDAAVEVARRHGGLVNYAFGEEIVLLFGIPTAHEDDDLRAVRAAMELHGRAREIGAPVTERVGSLVCLRSGVHAAPLVAQRLNKGPRRYGVTGAPPQVASRLASLAPRNGVLVSPECQRVVAPFVQSEPIPPVIVEADAGPITPYRVIGESGLQTRLEAAVRGGLTPYTGRRAELETLEAQFARARGGEGATSLVVGEAGAGKSRLLHELRERVARPGIRVLQGRCQSQGGATPYLPFVEIMRDALDLRTPPGIGGDEVAARVRAIDPSLEPFVALYLHLLSIPGENYQVPRYLQGEHLQAALLDALAALLTQLARALPTIVLLEDWHWADDGSRAALGRLTEIAAAHALLIVVTSRPDAVDSSGLAQHTARIYLEPLDYGATVAIMQAVLHVQRVSADLARRIHERTGGNPFFLEEVCHTLVEQGRIGNRDGEGVAASGVETLSLPDTVQAVIRTRLDGLDERSLELLRVASVIGREFTYSLLVDAIGSDVDPARALERLKGAGLVQQISVVPELGYRFKHVVTQEVTYDSLLAHQKRKLHGVIGRAIERRDADRIDERAELLAHHFSRAEAWPEAVRYGRRAAERASALSQFGDALDTLDRVQEWVARLPDTPERRGLVADLLLQQERLCETLGQRGRQQQIIGQLIALLAPRGASTQLAQAYLRQGDLSTLLRRFDAAERALATALRICRERGETALERHALRSIGLLRWHEERHTDALALIESALAIDRDSGDELAVAGDLINLGIILKSMGEHTRALESFEKALAMPALRQDPSKLVYNLHSLANVHRAIGDLDRALAYLHQADGIASANLLPIQRSFHLTSIAHIYLQQGRVGESLQTYAEAVELSRRARHADGLVQALRTLGEVLFNLGKEDAALPRLTEAAHLFAQLEDRNGEVEMWTRVAGILERKSANEAVAAWENVRRLRQSLGDVRGELEALDGVARAIRTRGAPPAETIPHVEAALVLATTLGDFRREAALRNRLGILEWEGGRYAEALRHYELALRLFREQGDHAGEGLALNSLGVTLGRLDRHEEAMTVLENSIALNRERGQQLLEAHALAALGDICRARGRVELAVQCFEQSLALRRVLGDTNGETAMRERLSEAAQE
jgi:serine/threonine protein kinase/tetratricopeptide (TPR) repeat protein